jgi:ERCC4-type nuclease
MSINTKNKIHLKIDHRESRSNIFDLLDSKHVNYEKTTLDCGDFVIMLNDNPFIVIEKKNYNDLNASFKDKRYNEQINRLQNIECKKILLLEGCQKYKYIDSIVASLMVTFYLYNHIFYFLLTLYIIILD